MTAPDDLGRLLQCAAEWRSAGHGLALATVVKTWGSAPRQVGAMLLIRDDGLFEGSVSGGCVEGAVIEAARARIGRGGGELLHFGVASERAWEVGLACGGEIDILVQTVDDGAFPPALLRQLALARDAGRPFSIATDFASWQSREGDAGDFVHRFDPRLRLLLVGAVHISQALAPLARRLGHEVRIVDPRGLFAVGPRFAGFEVDPRWPDEALTDWRPDAASAIVCLTHDPKLDDAALAVALRSPAYYVAALGSRRTHGLRRQRLAAQGFTPADLDRIHGPAGIGIGAANPAEIAVSVAAEMIAAWRQRP